MSRLLLPICVFIAGLLLIVRKDNAETIDSMLDRARSLGIAHIARLPRGSMIIFDFDDTLFDPSTIVDYVHVGKRDFWYSDRKALPIYKPIRQVCDILRFAVQAGMYVTLITARPDSRATKQTIIENFRKQKLQLHEYHANAHYPKHNNFKAVIRSNIQKFRPIGLSIGDQWGDVNEASYHYIKLPNSKERYLYTTLQTEI